MKKYIKALGISLLILGFSFGAAKALNYVQPYQISVSTSTSGQVLTNVNGTTTWSNGGTGSINGSGTPTQVAYFCDGGTSTLCSSANLFWDATNSFLGIATSVPTSALTVNGSTTFPTITNGSILFATSSGVITQNNSKLFWDNQKNALAVGTTTPTRPTLFGSAASFIEAADNSQAVMLASSNNVTTLLGSDTASGYIGTQTNSQLKIEVGGSQRATFSTAGGFSLTGVASIQSGSLTGGIILGADSNATSSTAGTTKTGRLAFLSQGGGTNFTGLIGAADGTDNSITIGGGTGSLNAATKIIFDTSNTTTTTNGTQRLIINSTGLVGIGPVAPTGLFQVNATSTGTMAEFINSDGSAIAFGTSTVPSGSLFSIASTTNAGGVLFNVKNNGQIGIGSSTASTTLTVNGDAYFSGGITFNGTSTNLATSTFASNIVSMVGSATNPSLSFSGDTTTGIFQNGAGVLSITNAGVEGTRFGAGILTIISNTGLLRFGTAADAILTRDAADNLAFRRGTNAQSLGVYNTFTSATNYERGVLDWQHSTNTFLIGTENASGTSRNLAFETGSTTRMTINTSGNVGIGTTTPNSTLQVFGNFSLTSSSTVVTPSIGGGALLAGACTSATSSVDTSISSSTAAFVTTPQINAGDGFFAYTFLSGSGVITTKVCASVAGTPTASAYNVKIIK